jgi:4-amino-4-deoxy-L-arabinose transferase-like glycosyltransferase
MMQNNNWIVPFQYGYPYCNKPPFYNWVIGSSFILFGTINEFTLRFPGVISLLLTAFLIYSIGKNYLNNHVALLGAGIFLTMADLFFYGSINAGEIDLFYTLIDFRSGIIEIIDLLLCFNRHS